MDPGVAVRQLPGLFQLKKQLKDPVHLYGEPDLCFNLDFAVEMPYENFPQISQIPAALQKKSAKICVICRELRTSKNECKIRVQKHCADKGYRGFPVNYTRNASFMMLRSWQCNFWRWHSCILL